LLLLPDLAVDELTGAVRYFDGFTNDARLVLDTLRSAHKHGAQLFNYAALVSSERESDVWRSHVEDQESAQKVEIRSRAIVNAAGAWADLMPASRTPLRLTKGVHLVIDRSRLPIPEAVVMPDSKRILFAIPWGERVILGTTDTDYTGDRDTPTCEPEDAEYILRITNMNFPSAHLSAADIRSTYAGLRPLIADQTGGPSDISRRHVIRQTDPGWFDVAGGKLTTYRLMAEQTVDQLTSAPCTTASTPLLEESNRVFSGILPPPVSREAVEHFCRNEWAKHLDDVMLRRTSWQHYVDDPEMVAEKTSQWMAHALGWDQTRREDELRRYREVSAKARLAVGRGE
jgi:glycerol-3-phosphate dehydrogenase